MTALRSMSDWLSTATPTLLPPSPPLPPPPPLVANTIVSSAPPCLSLQRRRTPPLPLNPVSIVYCHHLILCGTICCHVGNTFCLKLQQTWILNDDKNHSCHVKFVAFQNAEFALGSFYGAFFATRMTSDNKDHLGQNDRKDSHYNLIQSNGLADLDLMPIRVFNRIVCN